MESSENPSDKTLDEFKARGNEWFTKLENSVLKTFQPGCYTQIMQVHTLPGQVLTGESIRPAFPGLEEMIREYKPSQPGCFDEVHTLPGQPLTGEMAIDLGAKFLKKFEQLLLKPPTALPGCYTTLHTVPKGLENLMQREPSQQ